MSNRKRYVLAGTGSRGLHMYAKPLLKEYGDYCELVGLFDNNALRIKAANDLLGVELPGHTDFQKMLKDARPDAVIITTPDATHAQYVVQTLGAGVRAISEKPLCVDAKQCREILHAERENSGRAECFVTHNMRYTPSIAEMKRLIDEGAIGEIKSINFHENLDRRHGADYFRRWHRIKKNSGGLLLQKSSHHFDCLNWIAGSVPDRLVAQGALTFYGKNGRFRHTRCEGCPHATECEFFVEMFENAEMKQLYKGAEKADGYLRDGCVFDNEIDIEDQMSVLYTYKNGVHVTYSLTAFASYEGWHIQFEGTRGRLELKEVHNTQWAGGKSAVHGMSELMGQHLYLYSFKEGLKKLEVPEAHGAHGGADEALQRDFFGRPFDAPPTSRQASVAQAMQAVLIGHAANESMASGSQPVNVQALLD